ncbi:MAG: ABC transporter substrate-binding protein [Myxococcales bacterium]|jgi:ABC-type transport system substrate-binding protein
MTSPTFTRSLRLALLLLSLTVAACDCSGGAPATNAAGEPKKVFNYLRGASHKSLDPVKQFDSASADLVSNLYDTLLSYHYLKRPYELIPNLAAEMPSLAEDGVTYTFQLRKDVRFHDDECFPDGKGRPLVADDVIYSFKRFADANLNGKSYILLAGRIEGMDEFREATREAGKGADYEMLQISGVKKIDDHTVQIRLTQPNPTALSPFAATQLSIVPREAVEHYGFDFERRPVGTGPFKIKKLSRRGMTILEKNPNYHLTYPSEGDEGDEEAGLLAARGKQLPFVDEVHLPLIEEAQPAMLKFKRGQLDWIGIDKDNFTQMAYRDAQGFHLKPEYAKKFEIYAEPTLVSEYFVINMQDELLGKNKALRQAMAYAIDAAGYVEQMRNGRGVALETIVPIPIAGSQRDVKAEWYDRNVDMAKQKLAEAGYPGGKGLPPITIEYRASTTESRQSFEFYRAALAEADITVKPNFQTFSAFLKKVNAGNFQMTSSGWAADYPDAENFYQLLYGPNKTPGPNASTYQNPEYDALFEKMRFMAPGPERNAIIEKMAAMIRDDVPVIITWTPIAVGMHQRWVKNLKRHMMMDTPFKYLDIDPAAKAQGLR